MGEPQPTSLNLEAGVFDRPHFPLKQDKMFPLSHNVETSKESLCHAFGIGSQSDVDRSLTFFISEQTMVNHAAEASQLISSLQYLSFSLVLWVRVVFMAAALSRVINITNGPPSDKQNKCCSIY